MIPLRDNIPSQRRPIINYSIIGLNCLGFLLELASGRYLQQVITVFGFIPARFFALLETHPEQYLAIYLPFLSTMFLHGGWLHLLGNMLYLWIFGDNIECALGSPRFLAFYLLCGMGAALAQVAVDPTSRIPMIGASGAVSGVLGAYLLLFPQAEVETLILFGFFARLVRMPAVVVLGWWIVLQLLSGVASLGMNVAGGVAWFAHVGGFAAGLVLVIAFRRRRWWEGC
ncbi:MAG TPA: rhomboid family intramembrane serine protease [Desulfobacterales bacterium]|nr:rhomboid family intramembrane serine protease [Desulfobacterales bacterium]